MTDPLDTPDDDLPLTIEQRVFDAMNELYSSVYHMLGMDEGDPIHAQTERFTEYLKLMRDHFVDEFTLATGVNPRSSEYWT